MHHIAICFIIYGIIAAIICYRASDLNLLLSIINPNIRICGFAKIKLPDSLGIVCGFFRYCG